MSLILKQTNKGFLFSDKNENVKFIWLHLTRMPGKLSMNALNHVRRTNINRNPMLPLLLSLRIMSKWKEENKGIYGFYTHIYAYIYTAIFH